MKTLLFILTLCVITPALAETQETKEEMVDLMFINYKNRLDLLQLQDQLLQSLLNIPFDKRVYVYPALFESHNIPKKIVTHPQILVWKGKKPTRIAPQLQEYAKEHLEFMPAKFYPLLDPDAWPKRPNKEDWHNVTNILGDVIVNPAQTNANAVLDETK